MTTYAIGDIHGCLRALQTLLKHAPIQPTDQIVFLGDYIDRGENSKGVIDEILMLKTAYHVIALRGNHEARMLEARENPIGGSVWTSCGGFETLCSYNAQDRTDWPNAIPDSHWRFLETTLLFHEAPQQIFVHGSLDATRQMDQQDPEHLLWQKCYQTEKHSSGKPIICGHTPHLEGRPGNYDWGICADTAACRGGWLTCIDVSTGRYWQANESGNTRNDRIRLSSATTEESG